MDSLKSFFGALFSGQADPNYFHSYGFKDMGYDSYSFLINGSAMLFISAIALGAAVLIFALSKVAAT